SSEGALQVHAPNGAGPPASVVAVSAMAARPSWRPAVPSVVRQLRAAPPAPHPQQPGVARHLSRLAAAHPPSTVPHPPRRVPGAPVAIAPPVAGGAAVAPAVPDIRALPV